MNTCESRRVNYVCLNLLPNLLPTSSVDPKIVCTIIINGSLFFVLIYWVHIYRGTRILWIFFPNFVRPQRKSNIVVTKDWDDF